MKFLIAFFSISLATSLFAQPGGGGGLNISYITEFFTADTLQPNDPKLRIRQHVLDRRCEKILYTFPGSPVGDRDNNAFDRKTIYLPHTYDEGKAHPALNQRLEILYGVDTMVIDFVGISGENGAGRTDQMDEIRFTPGYFRLHLMQSERFDSCWAMRPQFPDQLDKLREDLGKGITPSTMNNLMAWNILDKAFNPRMDIIMARYNREMCTETDGNQFPWKTRLCPDMMKLSSGQLRLSTIQSARSVEDTLYLRYHYYFTFDNPSRHRIAGRDAERLLIPIYPAEEAALAQSYIDALTQRTLYVNNVPYTGIIALDVTRYRPGVESMYGTMTTHYYFQEGKFIFSYVPLRAEPGMGY
jgi:hypothetical protein